MSLSTDWPDIKFETWQDTCAGLHLWSQIVGKYRTRHTPWVNHSWHVTFYVTPRGLTTGPVPDGPGQITVDFDFRSHELIAECSNGHRQTMTLEAMSVAEFLDGFKKAITSLGGDADIHGSPNEIPDAIPFAEDTQPRPYDHEAVERFHQALILIDNAFNRFRSGFIGKVSPSHFFWGSFDLAVTRFSGRRAPIHPGGVPALPDDVAQEAYSDEVSSLGFWPGQGVGEAMFYSYAHPDPDGFKDQPVKPDAAYWSEELGEFLLPYEAVRTAHDPEVALMAFMQSTYEAAANTADWDRDALECEIGMPGKVRDFRS